MLTKGSMVAALSVTSSERSEALALPRGPVSKGIASPLAPTRLCAQQLDEDGVLAFQPECETVTFALLAVKPSRYNPPSTTNNFGLLFSYWYIRRSDVLLLSPGPA